MELPSKTIIASDQVSTEAGQAPVRLPSSETDNTYWKRFNSGNASSNKPVLSVTYNSYPNKPTGMQINGVAPSANSIYYTKDTTPTFKITVSDPDGTKVKALYTIKQGTTTKVADAAGSNVASGSTSSYTSAALAQGKEYTVTAYANDGSLDSKNPATPSWSFFVDTVAPGTTSITSGQVTAGEWLETAPSSISAAFQATDAVSFEYKVDGGTTKTVTASSGSASVTGLPKSNGGHWVQARAIDRASNGGPWQVFQYGVGGVELTEPRPGQTTTDVVKVRASGPPGLTGPVTRTLYWRESGSSGSDDSGVGSHSSDSWELLEDLGSVDVGTTNEINYALETSLLGDESSRRTPLRIDLQACFTYEDTASSAGSTQCTWNDDPDSHTSIVRLASAFDAPYPTAQAGPGELALWSGEFNLAATDVSIAGYAGPMEVTRTYSSLAGGTEDSVFGPGWTSSFAGGDLGSSGLQVIDTTDKNGMITFRENDGAVMLFAQSGNAHVAQGEGIYPAVDPDTAALGYLLVVRADAVTGKTFMHLSEDAGITTTWVHEGSGEWSVDRVSEASSSTWVSFEYDAAGRVAQLAAPTEQGVECSGELVPGCRVLTIDYYLASDAASGAYEGRVSSIGFTAWDPDSGPSGAIRSVVVASYRYDSAGYLTSAMDPRSGQSTHYEYGALTTAGVPTLTAVLPSGLATWHFDYGQSSQGPDSLLAVSRDGALPGTSTVTLARFVYGIDVADAPPGSAPAMEAATAWGLPEDQAPTAGFAVFPQGVDPGTSDPAAVDPSLWPNATMYFTANTGATVSTAVFGANDWQFTAVGYDEWGNAFVTLDAIATSHLRTLVEEGDGEAVAADDLLAAATVTAFNDAVVAQSDIAVAVGGDPDISVVLPAGTVLAAAGSFVTDVWSPVTETDSALPTRLHTHYEYDQGAPNGGIDLTTGAPYSLVTSVTESSVRAHESLAEASASNAPGNVLRQVEFGYDPIDGSGLLSPNSGWTLGLPTSTTVVMGSGEEDIVTEYAYDELGRTVVARSPGSSGDDLGTEAVTYYTAGSNAGDPACGNSATWAGLPCVKVSAGALAIQTEDRIAAYDFFLAPATRVETRGDASRTTQWTYNPDGSVASLSKASSGVAGDFALGATSFEVDSATGLTTAIVAEATATTAGSRVETSYDKWGRVVAYTDSDGAQTTTTYGDNGQVASVDDGVHVVEYRYDGTDALGAAERRSLPTSMTIAPASSADGSEASPGYAISGAYDAAGRLVLQVLPGGITQRTEYSRTSAVLSLGYSVLDDDGQEVALLAWNQAVDVYGRSVSQLTPNGAADPDSDAQYNRSYEYDRAGRLVAVSDRTAVRNGESADGGLESICSTRAYAFDSRGNRVMSARETSIDDGLCSDPLSGTVDIWQYDDEGRVRFAANSAQAYEYDDFGRQTLIPGADTPSGATAGDLEIEYYVNDLVRSLAQGGLEVTNELDALFRQATSTTVHDGLTSKVVSHYGDLSGNPRWAERTEDGASSVVTWYGESLGGALGLAVTGGSVTVPLVSISGDASLSITAAPQGGVRAIGAYTDYDEYGNARVGSESPDTGAISYGWRGSAARPTSDVGLVQMGVRMYNPVTGLFTSADPLPSTGGTVYGYVSDPVNQADPTGANPLVAALGIPQLAISVLTQVLIRVAIISAAVFLGFIVIELAKAISHVSWPSIKSVRYRANKTYNVYVIRTKITFKVWKYGITSVGASRPTSQVAACTSYFRATCKWHWLKRGLSGWYTARLWEASFITAYVFRRGHCPPGQIVSCR